MFRFIDFSKLFWSATISQKCTKECSLKYQSYKVTSEASHILGLGKHRKVLEKVAAAAVPAIQTSWFSLEMQFTSAAVVLDFLS